MNFVFTAALAQEILKADAVPPTIGSNQPQLVNCYEWKAPTI